MDVVKWKGFSVDHILFLLWGLLIHLWCDLRKKWVDFFIIKSNDPDDTPEMTCVFVPVPDWPQDVSDYHKEMLLSVLGSEEKVKASEYRRSPLGFTAHLTSSEVSVLCEKYPRVLGTMGIDAHLPVSLE